MVFITGGTRSRKYLEILRRYGVGRMVVDKPILPYAGEPWAFDNGAYRDWKNGKAFDGPAFLGRLEKIYPTGKPFLAVTPDIVCGGERSLEFSLAWVGKLPPEWPWFLAVQDGMKTDSVEKVLHFFHGIFLGGSDAFKGTAPHWCRLAHAKNKRFHFGRAGTLRKVAFARRVGADSCDSAFPLWSMRRFEQFLAAWKGDLPYEQLELWPPEEFLPAVPGLSG